MAENSEIAAADNLTEEVAQRLLAAGSRYQDELSRIVKSAGLTLPQYRVLRILRAAEESLSCSEIAGRMISRDPDITRLIDKLVKLGYASRERCNHDRRVVRSCITEVGREKLAPLDQPYARLHKSIFGDLREDDLRELGTKLAALS